MPVVSTVGDFVTANCTNAGTVGIVISANTNVTFIPEASVNGTNWATVLAYPAGNGAGSSSITTTGTWTVPAAGFQQIRMRVSAIGATPTATVELRAGDGASSGPQVSGGDATGTAPTQNPFPVAGLYSIASTQTNKTVGTINYLETNKVGNLKTVVTGFSTAPYDTNNVVLMPMSATSNSESLSIIGPLGMLPFVNSGSANFYLRGDAGGAVMQVGSIASARTNYAPPTGGIVNTTTAVTFIAAGGAGVRNYVTNITVDWDALTNATEVAIRDGAAGTVLWRMKIPAGVAGMREVDFTVPLKGTANTLMEVVTLTASGAGGVFFNAGIYQAA